MAVVVCLLQWQWFATDWCHLSAISSQHHHSDYLRSIFPPPPSSSSDLLMLPPSSYLSVFPPAANTVAFPLITSSKELGSSLQGANKSLYWENI